MQNPRKAKKRYTPPNILITTFVLTFSLLLTRLLNSCTASADMIANSIAKDIGLITIQHTSTATINAPVTVR